MFVGAASVSVVSGVSAIGAADPVAVDDPDRGAAAAASWRDAVGRPAAGAAAAVPPSAEAAG